jgi:hypothetical protein
MDGRAAMDTYLLEIARTVKLTALCTGTDFSFFSSAVFLQRFYPLSLMSRRSQTKREERHEFTLQGIIS